MSLSRVKVPQGGLSGTTMDPRAPNKALASHGSEPPHKAVDRGRALTDEMGSGVGKKRVKRRNRVPAECCVCGASFTALDFQVAKGKGRCCSLSCAAALAAKNRRQDGENNNNWRNSPTVGAKRSQNYRTKNPEKARAHWLVKSAIRRGDLVRQPCRICGATPTEAHHHDYTRPLDVHWLCREHHVEVHSS